MKKAIAAAILVCAAGGAFAQTNTPAVATSTTQKPRRVCRCGNNRAESKAKSRETEGAGCYRTVSGLVKDKDGVWRGKASKAGAMVTVRLDYQGNITAN